MQPISKTYALKVVKIQQQSEFMLTKEQAEQTVSEILQLIAKVYGYSPYIFLYRQSVTSFNALHFINLKVPLIAVLQQFEEIAVTHNNLQFIEEYLPFHSNTHFKQHTTQCVFVIIQSQQNTYFHNQTYKLSLDCKIMFLLSLASRYGRHPCLIYYDFRVPLAWFDKDETLKDALLKFRHVDEHIIISAEDAEVDVFIKTVRNKQIIDTQRYHALRTQGSDRYMIIAKPANLSAIQELIQMIYQTEMQLVDSQGKRFKLKEMDNIKTNSQIYLTIKAERREYLPIKLEHSIYVGNTQHYQCFVESSYILHVFSAKSPLRLISSCLLQCQPDLHLQQQIPLIHDNSLVMYNITRSAIILKYYTIPAGIQTQTKHYRWDYDLYQQIYCQSLDLLGVTLKKRNAIRLFYIYHPNDFMDVEFSHIQGQRIWIAKVGNNSHSDGSGHFAVEHAGSNKIHIYDLKKKQKIGSIYTQKVKDLCFFSNKTLILMQIGDCWLQFDYLLGSFLKKYQIETNQRMFYSPSGILLAFTQQSLRQPFDCDKKRIGFCVFKQGETIFSKDYPNQMYTIQYIYDISNIYSQHTNSHIHHSAQKFSN